MVMPGRRNITQKKPQFGNNRSHSLKATRRKFKLNMQNKRIYVVSMKQFVRVQATAQEFKTIDKIGLEAFLKRQGRTIKSLLPKELQGA